MPQIKLSQKNSRLALVGQVKDAITQEGISAATVKIKAAPVKFVEQILFKIKLFGIPLTAVQWYGLKKFIFDQADHKNPALDNLQSILKNTPLQEVDGLGAWVNHLEQSSLSPQDRFQVLQVILDGLALAPSRASGLERTATRPDGWFHWVDLPAGVYQLEASVPGSSRGYGQALAEVEVVEGGQDPFAQSQVSFHLSPTILQGSVVSAADLEEPVGMARVQIAETLAYVFSSDEFTKPHDREWNYQFVGIASTYPVITLIITAKGYETTQKKVDLRPGANNSLDIQLVSL